jgi:hypothetical protein
MRAVFNKLPVPNSLPFVRVLSQPAGPSWQHRGQLGVLVRAVGFAPTTFRLSVGRKSIFALRALYGQEVDGEAARPRLERPHSVNLLLNMVRVARFERATSRFRAGLSGQAEVHSDKMVGVQGIEPC